MSPSLVRLELPVVSANPPRRLPRWLKRRVPKGNANHFTAQLLGELQLETVCDNALCPNRMECYSQKTATFMILGNVCTRPCGFCAVSRGKPLPPDPDEPRRVAEAAGRLGLKHVVITSVTRDDLPDGGASHFAECVRAVRERTGATVEVLTPDFVQQRQAVATIVAAAPEVFNHNTETVPRLVSACPRSQIGLPLDLGVAPRSETPEAGDPHEKRSDAGLGRVPEEVLDVFADLLDYGCDFLTLGQYLPPAERALPVERYVPPEEFDELGRTARSLGFQQVASGPFVRSSYHARDMVGSR